MRNWFAVAILIFFLIFGAWYLLQQNTKHLSPQTIMTLTITSPAFQANGEIPQQFTCDGAGVSPELIFDGIPPTTESLVLIMDDPDAPRGVWDHWVVWNMPAETTGIGESMKAPGEVGVNSGGRVGYASPCPPDREHRYFFTLYALDTTLTLAPGSTTKNELLQALASHVIESAQLIGRYRRN